MSVLSISERQIRLPDRWRVVPAVAASLGAAGALVCWLVGRGAEHALSSWLFSLLYFLSIALGSLFFVLVLYATKAGWGVVLRRIAESAISTLPWFALFFLPIAFGLESVFHWAEAGAAAHDPLLEAKSPYLNGPFFIARALVYFAAWSALALAYSMGSRSQDESGSEAVTRRLQKWSGPGIAVFALSVTFAAFDWIMSLDPHWYSTIFGVYWFAGCLVASIAFLIVVVHALKASGTLTDIVTVEHLHDLGKLLFAFTVFWAYIAFSQFFLIWYANIPEETAWYLHRLEGGWRPVTLFLAAGHFGLPFLFLMPRTIKRRPGLLLAGALWMLLLHGVDLYWLVHPTFSPHGPHVGILDVAAFLGVGGFFVAFFIRALGRGALVPIRDPRFPESLSFKNT